MAKQPKIDLERVLPKGKTAYDPGKQVAGYKKRLGASALPSAKVEDGRNAIERALNLRPNQGPLFDVLEVLDRPRSAIAGAAVALQQGENVGEALKAGITGQKFTSWKEYLVNTGLEDNEGKIDFVDVAGTVMDMFVDPLNIPMWGVSKFAGKTKSVITEATKLSADMSAAIKGLDATADITKVANFSDKTVKLTELADQLSSLTKNSLGQEMSLALKNAAEATTREGFNAAMSAFSTIATSKKTVSTMSLLGRGVGLAASGTIKGADKAITNLLTGLDNLNLKTGGAVADDIVKYAKEITAIDRYTNFKQFVSSVFDKTAVLGDRLANRVKMTMGKAGFFGEEGKVFVKMYDDVVKAYASTSGKSIEESGRLLMRLFESSNYQGITNLGTMVGDVETMRKVGMSLQEVERVKTALSALKDVNTGKAFYTPKTIEAMFNRTKLANGAPVVFFKPTVIDDVAKKYKLYRETIENLGKQFPDFSKLSESAKELFDADIYKAKFLTATEIEQFNKLMADPVVAGYIDELSRITNSMYKTVDNRLGGGLAYLTTEFNNTKVGNVITPHQLTPETQKLFNQYNEIRFFDKRLKGNIKVGADRIYQMSAYESNMIYQASQKNILKYATEMKLSAKEIAAYTAASNSQLFTEYINISFADWISEAPRTIMQSKILADMVVTGTFADERVVRGADLIETKSGTLIPRDTPGMVNFSKQAFLEKVNEMARYQTDKAPFEKVKKILSGIKGDTLSIDANIFDLIGINTQGSVGSRTLLDLVDATNNAFKKFKLLSPGFHMRNFVGNFFNMIVGGVDPTKTLKYQSDVFYLMTRGSDLIEKTVRAGVNLADDTGLLQVLTNDELRLYKILKDYSFANLPKAGRMLWDLPEDVTKLLQDNAGDTKKLKAYEKAFRYNAQANEIVDTYFRLQTYMFARENPEILLRYGLANPQDLVRRIHFDPADLSVVEKNFLKRVIPFYTFTKKNLAFQMRNLTDNPRLYKQIATLFDGVWKAKDIDPYLELEEYKRDQFWLPIFKQEDGKYFALKLNLPIGDLNEFLNNPLQRTASAFTPMVRAPFELAANTQIFSGLPIQEFPGQKAYSLNFLNNINKIPGFEMFPTRTAEYIISQSGLDVPLSLVGGTAQGVADMVSGQAGIGQLISEGIGRSVVSEGSAEKGIRSRQYQELRRLQGLVRYAKQEGIEVPAIAEVENKNSTLNTLIKKIRMRGLAK